MITLEWYLDQGNISDRQRAAYELLAFTTNDPWPKAKLLCIDYHHANCMWDYLLQVWHINATTVTGAEMESRVIWKLRIGNLAAALDKLPLTYQEKENAQGLINQLWDRAKANDPTAKDMGMWPWIGRE